MYTATSETTYWCTGYLRELKVYHEQYLRMPVDVNKSDDVEGAAGEDGVLGSTESKRGRMRDWSVPQPEYPKL